MTRGSEDRPVREFMREAREVVHPDHPLREAVARFKDQPRAILPVADGAEIVGVLTPADVAAHDAEEQEEDADGGTTVSNVMTADFFFCFEDESVAAARTLMARHRCRHLIVTDRDRGLVGILSTNDLPPGEPVDVSDAAHEEASGGRSGEPLWGGLEVHPEKPRVKPK